MPQTRITYYLSLTTNKIRRKVSARAVAKLVESVMRIQKHYRYLCYWIYIRSIHKAIVTSIIIIKFK